MKINWKVRIQKKSFWIALVSGVILLVQIVSGWFDYTLAADLINAEATRFINAVFGIFVVLGIVNDPTTKGLSDSKQARHYKKPRDNA
ncbi:phage holin [Virgibacillus dokdonensis]|uniref:Bacteriophage holin n=1 Tax=Virgibacillus dokdonensis TaxID=302167 RepID=A0A2K9J3L1_9BACI|nr:phage holin [Virgibacillus dokdonensis]AUJ26538.1 Bacteriophage holin [Virgibacillus dokdonensis]